MSESFAITVKFGKKNLQTKSVKTSLTD